MVTWIPTILGDDKATILTLILTLIPPWSSLQSSLWSSPPIQLWSKPWFSLWFSRYFWSWPWSHFDPHFNLHDPTRRRQGYDHFVTPWSSLWSLPCSSPRSNQQTTSQDTETQTQRHRHRDTDTETQTQTQTHRHRHRHTDTDTQRHRDTETQRHRDTDTETHRHTETQRHRDTETQRHRHRQDLVLTPFFWLDSSSHKKICTPFLRLTSRTLSYTKNLSFCLKDQFWHHVWDSLQGLFLTQKICLKDQSWNHFWDSRQGLFFTRKILPQGLVLTPFLSSPQGLFLTRKICLLASRTSPGTFLRHTSKNSSSHEKLHSCLRTSPATIFKTPQELFTWKICLLASRTSPGTIFETP